MVQTLSPQEFERVLNAPSPRTEVAFDGGLGSPFLRLLATAGREQLSRLITEKTYAPGDIIFKEDEIGLAMYIIWSGRVAVVKGGLESPTVLGYRGVGEIIGEMGLLENRPRSATVVALEEVRALSLTRQDFETLLSENPSVGLSILSTLSARLRAADDARKASSRSETQLTRRVSQLQTEKQQLLELERLRQDTIDLIVHDLRHPISSIFGAIKILEMVLPEEVLQDNAQLISIANSNCDHLQVMVESLLDIATMEAGDDDLNRQSIQIEHLVTEAVDQTQAVTDMENITAVTKIPEDLPPVLVDEEKLHRILSNLVNNAIKFTPSGGEISVVVEPVDDMVQISVSDTGPGIPVEDRERIFDRFAQLDGNGPRIGGFGLGLTFCKMAVEAHGGQIWIEDGKGGENGDPGSTFAFTLPQSPSASAETV